MKQRGVPIKIVGLNPKCPVLVDNSSEHEEKAVDRNVVEKITHTESKQNRKILS